MSRSTRIVLVLCALAGSAAADDITVGVFTPSAPFSGPVPRLEFASKLAAHLGSALGGKGTGHAYARAGDFSAAVRRGEIQYAVIDAPYAAALGSPYKVLATAVRDGSPTTAWQLVSTGGKSLAALKGKVVAVPDIGARENDFVLRVLFESELPDNHFGKILTAPDALSALAAVEHGRAEAALVPAGLPLPGGVSRVLTLASLGWPVLVALPGADEELSPKVAEAAAGFGGAGVFSGFQRGDAGLRAVAGRFSRPTRRGPMAVPPPRLAVDTLLVGRDFKIERLDVAALVEAPALAKATPAAPH